MSRLKIFDLSFCQTKLQDEVMVQGGMFSYASITLYPCSVGIEYEGKNYIYGEETNSIETVALDITEDSLSLAGYFTSERGNSISTSSFAFSAKI